MRARQCEACGRGSLRKAIETLSVTLPRCGVVVRIVAPAHRCPACGEVHVEARRRARSPISPSARALADGGVDTGDALRHLRKALGLRAADSARLLGVTPETISHWETGRAGPTRAAFVAVAAMVEEAMGGRSTTRDRLERLAEERPHPLALTASLLARAE